MSCQEAVCESPSGLCYRRPVGARCSAPQIWPGCARRGLNLKCPCGDHGVCLQEYAHREQQHTLNARTESCRHLLLVPYARYIYIVCPRPATH
ncbi:hypothetical protein L211DRAFT_21294 [Terfezia boudieri ATCC MYA-4762]|uniref:Uncharacterized protein n=1 Tax=Terfezia boudieri ATCC MYA-4762 TaxID=1051890 RepID=A0A3N4M790_9PEZI|nr:hypothetical protein L211DRAFT_21294 [Terfezia boudieri ATCC MYA-4762]